MNKIVRCVKCKKEAIYDSPKELCEDHWIEWWVNGLKPSSKKQRQELTKAAKAIIHGMAGLVEAFDEAVHETRNLSKVPQNKHAKSAKN